jgi:hypothetical protein
MENAALWGEEVSKKVTFYLLFCFVLAFGGIGGSIWMAVANWFTNPYAVNYSLYSPIALIGMNIAIFLSSLLYMYKSSSAKESDF